METTVTVMGYIWALYRRIYRDNEKLEATGFGV